MPSKMKPKTLLSIYKEHGTFKDQNRMPNKIKTEGEGNMTKCENEVTDKNHNFVACKKKATTQYGSLKVCAGCKVLVIEDELQDQGFDHALNVAKGWV